jgi:ankyrin repeat protein
LARQREKAAQAPLAPERSETRADVNAANDDGSTALMRASRFGGDDVVEALLAKGADVNASVDGLTALQLARQGGRHTVAFLLVAAGGH